MDKNSKIDTKILTESAVLIAAGIILSRIRLIQMPFGGEVTLLSMLPFIIISFRYGAKAGVLSSFADCLLQIALGGLYMPPAGRIWALMGSIILDYILGFGILGSADYFRKLIKPKKEESGYLFGTFTVCFIRFLASFISGFLIWDSLTDNGMAAVVYSLGYNLSYMVPETILTMTGVYILYKKVPKIFGKKYN